MTQDYPILKLSLLILAVGLTNNLQSADRPALAAFLARSKSPKPQNRPQSVSPEIKSPIPFTKLPEANEEERLRRISTLTPLLSPRSRPDTPSTITELQSSPSPQRLTSPQATCEIESKSTDFKDWNMWKGQTLLDPISPGRMPTFTLNHPLVSESDNTVRPRLASSFAKLQILAQHNKPLNQEGIKALIMACIPFTEPSPEANKLEQEILGQRLCAIAETQSRLCPEPNPLTPIDDLNQLGKQLIRLGRSYP